MSQSLEHFFEDLGRWLLSGRTDLVAAQFTYPMPFYSGETLAVFPDPARLEAALRRYGDVARKSGVAQIRPRITAEGLPRGAARQIWVELDHLSAAGTVLRSAQVRYVVNAAQAPTIELVEYHVRAFPAVPPKPSEGCPG